MRETNGVVRQKLSRREMYTVDRDWSSELDRPDESVSDQDVQMPKVCSWDNLIEVDAIVKVTGQDRAR